MTEHAAGKGNTPRWRRTGTSVQTHLLGIANKAKQDPNYQFKNLYGMIDEELLMLAWRKLNKKAAAGVDQVKAQEYAKNLEANLVDLVERLKRGGYRAKMVRRKLIPKENGKTRPLGIPVLEDRLLQRAVALILEAIYEPTFLNCSYGYRRGRDAKMAVKTLRDELNFEDYSHVVEVDIKGFFDNLSHEELIKMLGVRIKDDKMMRLIGKWLKAGILDPEGMVIHPQTGTPQGGIVSPILANVYLHYVLDLWVEVAVRKQLRGRMKYVRYADDLIAAFSVKAEAERFYRAVKQRLKKFDLEAAEDKTRIVEFDRWTGRKNLVAFLGFELCWGKSRKGEPHLKRRTARKRLKGAAMRLDTWIAAQRSTRIGALIEKVNEKLLGHYGYYGVIGNSECLNLFFYKVNRSLFKWLNRRSQKRSFTWREYTDQVRSKLLPPRITETRVLQKPLFGWRC